MNFVKGKSQLTLSLACFNLGTDMRYYSPMIISPLDANNIAILSKT